MVGLLDTSVIIDLDRAEVFDQLPEETTVSAVTLGELAAGTSLARDRVEQARRQFRLQQLESDFMPIPFDVGAARCYGQIVASIEAYGRSQRRRIADLMIAATAMSRGFDLYTRNGDDFLGLEELLTIVIV